MEIRESWARAGGAKWALVAVPIAAAVVAGGVAASASDTYEAQANVTVNPSSGATAPAAVKQAVDTYRAQLTSDPVLAVSSEQTKISTADLRSGVSSRQVNTSNIVEVTFSASEQDDAVPGVTALSQNALVAYVAPAVKSAEAEVAAAQERVDAARAEVAAVSEETGIKNPEDLLREKSAVVTQLTIAVATTAARGESTAALEAAKARAQADLEAVRADAAAFEQPLDELNAAQDALERSQEELTATKALAAQAADGASIEVGSVTKVNQSSSVLRAAGAAAVAGLVLAALIALIVASFRRRPATPATASGNGTVPQPRSGATADQPTAKDARV